MMSFNCRCPQMMTGRKQGEWGMGSGEWGVRSDFHVSLSPTSPFHITHSLFPIPHSPLHALSNSTYKGKVRAVKLTTINSRLINKVTTKGFRRCGDALRQSINLVFDIILFSPPF